MTALINKGFYLSLNMKANNIAMELTGILLLVEMKKKLILRPCVIFPVCAQFKSLEVPVSSELAQNLKDREEVSVPAKQVHHDQSLVIVNGYKACTCCCSV